MEEEKKAHNWFVSTILTATTTETQVEDSSGSEVL